MNHLVSTERLLPEAIAVAFRSAKQQGWIRQEDSLLMFHDLDHLEQRIARLKAAFPPATLHAVAMKANPLIRIMEFLREQGMGVEAASIGEVNIALRIGYEPDKIVFDSPVKTNDELAFALREGIHLNLDSFAELARVDLLRQEIPSVSTIGIRVNPQVGTGTIAESSVAGSYSKFGVPIGPHRRELIEAFGRHEWLTGLHLHVGSQGCSKELLINGVGVLYDLMEEVNTQFGPGRIRHFDIGGGLPVDYGQPAPPCSLEGYALALKQNFPSLFTAHCSLFTEFGRWFHVNAGWTVSRVEYVKHEPGIRTAMIHAGADLFLRECLLPTSWRHDYLVLDPEGNLKTGTESTPCHLAGPLCFSGDMLAKNLTLPEIREGDYLVVRDTGGYTLSMWSRYNSRLMPRVLGYTGDEFTLLKERETAEDLYRFWS